MTSHSGKPIVVGVDDSASSDAALRWAMAEARRRKLGVTIVYGYWSPMWATTWPGFIPVPGDVFLKEEAQAFGTRMRERATALAPTVDVTVRVLDESPVAALLEC